MSELRQRMLEDMQLRGLSGRTQKSYVSAVAQLAMYYRKSPYELTEAEIRQYFLYLKNEKGLAPSTINQSICALKFLYQYTLKRKLPVLDMIKAGRRHTLPVVLSQAEVRAILGAVKITAYQVCLSTIYSCGLRLVEGVKLRVDAIDSERMMVHLRQSKGDKDRLVPLPTGTLQKLRRYWQHHRNQEWLFPTWKEGTSSPTINPSSVQKAFRQALTASGVKKKASVHTLRHSYATHLVEAGISLELVQQYLGHQSLQTTLVYVHLTPQRQAQVMTRINEIMTDLP